MFSKVLRLGINTSTTVPCPPRDNPRTSHVTASSKTGQKWRRGRRQVRSEVRSGVIATQPKLNSSGHSLSHFDFKFKIHKEEYSFLRKRIFSKLSSFIGQLITIYTGTLHSQETKAPIVRSRDQKPSTKPDEPSNQTTRSAVQLPPCGLAHCTTNSSFKRTSRKQSPTPSHFKVVAPAIHTHITHRKTLVDKIFD